MTKYFIICYTEQIANGNLKFFNAKLDKEPVEWLSVKHAASILSGSGNIVLISYYEISKLQYDKIILPLF
jgi:hypothetical protein